MISTYEMIYNNISVIVQGPVDDTLIEESIISIKEHLPKAEIIVSTWEGTEQSNWCSLLSSHDKIIFCKDPGFIKEKALGNINRQIIGRQNGLNEATKPYSLIIRSDSVVKNLNFISAFMEYDEHKYHDFHFFKKRVVVPSLGPIWKNCIYHINDWFFFGLTEDLKKLYDIPLVDTRNMNNTKNDPHRWLCQSLAEKSINNIFDNTTIENIEKYKKFILENFVATGFEEYFGVNIIKENYKTWKNNEKKSIIKCAYHLCDNFEYEEYTPLYNKTYNKKIPIRLRGGYYLSVILRSKQLKIFRKFCACFVPFKKLRKKIRGQS